MSTEPAAKPERRLLTHGRARLPGRLDDPWRGIDLSEPPCDELLALADGQRVVLWGGEPTMRRDLPVLLAGLNAPTLRTDGLALTQRPLVAQLARSGLAAARLCLHSARRDAHDWLADRKGATRAVIAAARAVVAEGLGLELEIVLTRPTASHLVETVDVAAHVGASALFLRRLVRRGPAVDAFVTLSPRIGLMEPWIEEAASAALRHGMSVNLEGLPRCAAPALPPHVFAPPPRWLVPSGPAWTRAAAALETPSGQVRCPSCPGPPACAGAPDDYTGLFGAREFESEAPPSSVRGTPSTVPDAPSSVSGVPIPSGVDDPTRPPPPRAGRSPATRLRAVHVQLGRGDLAGDPAPARGHAPADVAVVAWTAEESTRAVRVRLVRASQEGATTLRIAGGPGLRHPCAAVLLREATRLSVPRLELRGELSGLSALSDDELRRLRRFAAAVAELKGPTPAEHDAAVGTPGAFDATVDALQRLHRATRRRVDVALSGAWTGGELPLDRLPEG